MKIHDVSVEAIEKDTGSELSDTFYQACAFCEKLVKISSLNFNSCKKLGGNKFYCPFCLRHNFHHRSSRHVLALSFRAIIGHYYHKHYLPSTTHKPRRIWMNEITNYIDGQQRLGLCSPVFSYEPSTFLWFIDFNRVGKDSRKAPYSEVKDMVRLLLALLDLHEHYGPYAFDDMWKKYEKALDLFYKQRKRPKGVRMLIPTMMGTVHDGGKADYFQETRNFMRNSLVLK